MKFLKHATIAGGALALATATLVAQQINGAGATFPNPIYSKWFSEYNKLHPDVEINYQSIGSGGGIRQITERTVFFGATDGPMTPEQLQAAPGKILHFPTVLGAVVPAYNIPGVTAELKFTGPVLADIFLGKITKWNDPAIAKLNPGRQSASHATSPSCIVLTARARPTSGSTTSRRCRPSGSRRSASQLRQLAGRARRQGKRGRCGPREQTPGAIGYVELIYALQNKIAYGVGAERCRRIRQAQPSSR